MKKNKQKTKTTNKESDPIVELEVIVQGDTSIATSLMKKHEVPISKPKPTRFVVEAGAIIGLATGVVKLVSALVELAHKLRQDPQAPKVRIRNLEGAQLLLNEADEEKITSFIAES
jgi:hypothetical protein